MSVIYTKTQKTIETVMQSAHKLACEEDMDANQRKVLAEEIEVALRQLNAFFKDVQSPAITPLESVCDLQGASVCG